MIFFPALVPSVVAFLSDSFSFSYVSFLLLSLALLFHSAAVPFFFLLCPMSFCCFVFATFPLCYFFFVSLSFLSRFFVISLLSSCFSFVFFLCFTFQVGCCFHSINRPAPEWCSWRGQSRGFTLPMSLSASLRRSAPDFMRCNVLDLSVLPPTQVTGWEKSAGNVFFGSMYYWDGCSRNDANFF